MRHLGSSGLPDTYNERARAIIGRKGCSNYSGARDDKFNIRYILDRMHAGVSVVYGPLALDHWRAVAEDGNG